MEKTKVVVIGAGPAGLTAAYLLSKKNIPVQVLEMNPKYVGGIARTENYKGYLFDIGGHRFFSKSKEIEDLWDEILPNDLLTRKRSSRIYYRNKFFTYPIKAFEALFKLGVIESILCVLSYLKARMFPKKNPKNFEQWVSNQFGKRLYSIFFKTYTEKVWGTDCKKISADWAAQRIKGLSLASAIWTALLPKKKQSKNKDSSKIIKTLIDSFRYPRKGPGMMWEACQTKINSMGGEVLMGKKVTGLSLLDDSTYLVTHIDQNGVKQTINCQHVISTAPMRELINNIEPKPTNDIIAHANNLKYRDFLTVMVILDDKNLFDDNWIYIHESSVKVGRIQNFKSWSPEMVPDSSKCCYGMEYFCFENDGLWSSTDEQLLDLAKKELEEIGLCKSSEILDGCVVRQVKAYPVYDDDYKFNTLQIKNYLEKHFQNLHLIGRNGMHKYNNQDHAMMTAMLCVKNILSGNEKYDLWNVNEDAEYHESGKAGEQITTERMVPRQI